MLWNTDTIELSQSCAWPLIKYFFLISPQTLNSCSWSVGLPNLPCCAPTWRNTSERCYASWARRMSDSASSKVSEQNECWICSAYGLSIMNTMWCCYNMVIFLQNPHNRHPIAGPWRRGMGCLLWVWILTFILLLSLQSLIARFMGPTWGPSGADRTQVGPMLAPWTLVSEVISWWNWPCYNGVQLCNVHFTFDPFYVSDLINSKQFDYETKSIVFVLI